jgi:hypothetical protein
LHNKTMRKKKQHTQEKKNLFSWKMNVNRTNEWVWRWVVGVI